MRNVTNLNQLYLLSSLFIYLFLYLCVWLIIYLFVFFCIVGVVTVVMITKAFVAIVGFANLTYHCKFLHVTLECYKFE